MTAQIEDELIHEKTRNLITQAKGGLLFDPAPHPYRKMATFEFERGVLIAAEDRSAEMMLERLDRGHRPSPEEYEALFAYLKQRALTDPPEQLPPHKE